MKNEVTTDVFPDIRQGKSPATYCDLLEVILRRELSNSSELPDLWPIIEKLRATPEGEEIELTHRQWGIVDAKFRQLVRGPDGMEEVRWPVTEGFCQLSICLLSEMS